MRRAQAVAESAPLRTLRSTRGVFVGALGVLGCGVFAVVLAVDSPTKVSVAWSAGMLLFGWLVWVVLIRPCVRLGERDVWLVGSLRTVRIPAESIVLVSARRWLVIDVGERTYGCPTIGHSRRTLARAHQDPLRGLVMDDSGRHQVESQAERVRELLEEVAAAARRRPRTPIPKITSSWDRLPLGLLAVLLVAMSSVAALT